MLQLNNVHYAYMGRSRRVDVLHGVNCTFGKGRFYAIQGRSGSGKSTLLSLLAALDHPQEGEILFDGQPLRTLSSAKYRRSHVTTIFQQFNLLPYATVMENVMYPQLLNGVRPAQARERAAALLAGVDVAAPLHDRLPRSLSGGEQQRVAIARGLAAGAQVILADEPTGNLDEANGQRVVEILQKLAHEEGKTVIMVTHDTQIAACADQVYRMWDGRLVES